MLNFKIDRDKLQSHIDEFIQSEISKLRSQNWEVEDPECREEIEEEILDQIKDTLREYVLGK